MAFIRLTLVTPPPDRFAAVQQCYAEIVSYAASLPGFITGWVVVPGQDTGDVGRLTVWQTAAAAHHAATDSHLLALHAQAQFAAGGNSWDCSFATVASGAGADQSPAPALDPVAAVQAAQALVHARKGNGSDD